EGINYTEGLHLSKIHDGDYELVDCQSIPSLVKGTIGHYLNNALQGVLGPAEMILYLNDGVQTNIKKIHEAALRMKREIRAISSALDYLVRNRLGNDMLEDNVAGKQILNIKPFMKSQSDD
ncbi:MAG TPA: hypothetical protein VJH95_00600, partial [Candidatus Nanoarchaeia archaeon]|nr:hypothetical protein [Candidatus Nanoarchaeia archaeon]